LHGFFERLCQSPDQALKEPQKYAGYYFFYFQPDRQLRLIYRNLIHIYQEGGLLLSKQVERYPDSEFNLPRVMKHEGVVYSMSDRLVLTEREEQAGSSLWHSIFYASDYNRVTWIADRCSQSAGQMWRLRAGITGNQRLCHALRHE
jgi:hypothetical protein